jgi:hypothetical protein
MTMSNDPRETGWQRFLDRLKQLWGKSRRGGFTPVSTALAIAGGTSAITAVQSAPHGTQ